MNPKKPEIVFLDGELQICFPEETKLKPFSVSFEKGAVDYRRRLGGRGGSHPIYKAIGGKKCHVLDVTAGWCRDAFLLSSLGCQVTALEISEDVFRLVSDAIERGQKSEDVSRILKRLTLVHTDACSFLEKTQSRWDVIYFDPMFVRDKKKSENKKELQILQKIGHYSGHHDLEKIFAMAREKTDRVVVKRPHKSEPLFSKPIRVFDVGSIRFDIY